MRKARGKGSDHLSFGGREYERDMQVGPEARMHSPLVEEMAGLGGSFKERRDGAQSIVPRPGKKPQKKKNQRSLRRVWRVSRITHLSPHLQGAINAGDHPSRRTPPVGL